MFAKDSYIAVENFIDKDYAKYLCNYLEDNSICKGENDGLVSNSIAIYADPLFEKLLLESLEKVEKITNKVLIPSYSYARIYRNNAKLLKHIDRQSCEYSVSLCLEKDEDWPLMFKTLDTSEHKGICLDATDAFIYKGIDIVHWRNNYTGKKQIQAFFHYVEKDGLYSEWAFDKRKGLNIP